jgi:hypothetical protein
MFFPILFALNIFFFWRAFSMNFFKDDFFFLNISRIHSIGEFIGFFSPIRTYSYKPLASEAFYFLTGRNALIGHIVTFIVYFIGLIILYKVVHLLSKNEVLAKLTVVLYSLSSIHVFQLYWLATFQEVLVLTTLTASFYLYLHKKYVPSVLLYICALLSKETAILYVVFLVCFSILTEFKKNKGLSYNLGKVFKNIYVFIGVSLIFYITYQYSLKFVTSLDNYKLSFNPRLIANNAMWYYLWSWGAPNFMPDYMRSILSRPIPAFWTVFAAPNVKMYFYLLIAYLSLFFTSLIAYVIQNKKRTKNIFYFFIFSFIYFFIFLGPILLFPHRWMIRLTLPLIFISLFQAYVLYHFFKGTPFFRGIFIVLLCLYVALGYYGTKMHEDTSMFTFESKIVTNADNYFRQHAKEMKSNSLIYFANEKSDMSYCISWGGCAKKLENTFHGSFFLDYYFPDKNMKVEYAKDGSNKKTDGYKIDSSQFIK